MTLQLIADKISEQAGRRQVRSLLTVCNIDVYVFSCICHTPLIILIRLGLPLQTSLLLS